MSRPATLPTAPPPVIESQNLMAGNDHWTLHLEKLGMQGAGEELARLILTCQPPYAICVQGKWGSGKTSLMRYAMAKLGGEPLGTMLKTSRDPIRELPDWLDGRWKTISKDADTFIRGAFSDQCSNPDDVATMESRIVPIWFNPWQHQDSDMPLVALLQELRTQFSFLEQFGRFAGKLARTGVHAGLSILGDLVDTFSVLQGLGKTSLGQAPMNILKAVEAQRRRDFDEIHDAQRLNLMFELAVKSLLSPSEEVQENYPFGKDLVTRIPLRRLVIFVDDLDRCSELQTVRLLEAIKLYLQTSYCVFVVGMDGAAARRAVSNVLAHKGSEEAQEYLEKLFQTTLHVPVPGDYKTFVSHLLKDADLTQEKTGLDPAYVADRIVRLVEPNPRKLKNFVSTLAVGWLVRGRCKGPSVTFSSFLLLAFLRSYHPEAYRLLAYDPSLVLDLHSALTEGAAKSPPNASPVYLFFRRTFRHAFKGAFPEGFSYQRKDEDEVVTELITRLDRHKGDRAFVDLWRKEFENEAIEAVAEIVTKVLCSDQAEIQEA